MGPTMPSDEARVEARAPVYWPLGLSLTILVAGVVLVLYETYDLLGVVGLLLFCAGVYGLSRRTPGRRAQATRDASRESELRTTGETNPAVRGAE